MAILTCSRCGGLWADKPGETYAGTPCSCVPESNKSVAPPSVRSIEWVEELECALRHTEMALRYDENMKPGTIFGVRMVRDYLSDIIRAGRSSSTDKVSYHADNVGGAHGKYSNDK